MYIIIINKIFVIIDKVFNFLLINGLIRGLYSVSAGAYIIILIKLIVVIHNNNKIFFIGKKTDIYILNKRKNRDTKKQTVGLFI